MPFGQKYYREAIVCVSPRVSAVKKRVKIESIQQNQPNQLN